MAVFDDISKALKGIMLDNGTDDPPVSFGLPIAYEDVAYSGEDGEAHLEIFHIPAQPAQATLGDSGCDNHTGIFQIDIKYPTNSGVADIMKKADEINAVIKSGATFTQDSINVRIENVGISRVIVTDGYAVGNMTIEYFAFSERV